MEKHVVERRTKLLQDGGIKFVLNFEVGKDASLSELKEKHDAVLISTGVYKPWFINSSRNQNSIVFFF